MAILPRNTVVLAKVEGTKGTPETLDAAQDAVRINNGSSFQVTPEEIADDSLLGSLDAAQVDVVAATATITLPVTLRGSGAAGTPPETAPLFKACRFNEVIVASTSVAYTPFSGTEETITIGFHRDGLLWTAAGCVGDVAFECTAKGFYIATFTLSGELISKADAALPTPTFDNTTPVAWINGTATFDGNPVALETFSVAIGNTIASFSDPNATLGYSESVVSARDVRGSLNIPEVLTATRDIFNDNLIGKTTVPLVMTTGSTAGNITTINVPNARITNETPEDNQSVQFNSYDFQGTGPNNAMSVVFT